MAKASFFTSSIGKKVIMGATGLFLISFIVIHVSINSLIFLDLFNPNENGAAFKVAAEFMSHNPVVRVLEIGLMAGLIAHAIQGIVLTLQNKKKRPVKYAVVNGSANSTWYSRSMGLLGTLLLLFLALHLYDFWLPTKQSVFAGTDHDTFESMIIAFSNPIRVVIYLVGVASLCFHLMHGFQSAFRTFGLVHKKYTPIITRVGRVFSVVVSVLFALMPILIFLGLISN
jgi:succinate dehydrogenase / fumarate reductase cytochrome b subunit